jgi:hypothetical protein
MKKYDIKSDPRFLEKVKRKTAMQGEFATVLYPPKKVSSPDDEVDYDPRDGSYIIAIGTQQRYLSLIVGLANMHESQKTVRELLAQAPDAEVRDWYFAPMFDVVWHTVDTSYPAVYQQLSSAAIDWATWADSDEYVKVAFSSLDLIRVGLDAIEQIYGTDNPLRGEVDIYAATQGTRVLKRYAATQQK